MCCATGAVNTPSALARADGQVSTHPKGKAVDLALGLGGATVVHKLDDERWVLVELLMGRLRGRHGVQ